MAARMPADLLALLDKPLVLLIVMAVGWVIGIGLERTLDPAAATERAKSRRGDGA